MFLISYQLKMIGNQLKTKGFQWKSIEKLCALEVLRCTKFASLAHGGFQRARSVLLPDGVGPEHPIAPFSHKRFKEIIQTKDPMEERMLRRSSTATD